MPGEHRIPTAVVGFAPDSLLAALHWVLRQKLEGKCFLSQQPLSAGRAPAATQGPAPIDEAMDIVDANWRGIGTLLASGFALAGRHAPRR